MKLSGSMTALVTPMRSGEVDVDALKRLIDFQVDNGTSGLVPCGTTGESATLTHDEHNRVIRLTIEHANGRVPVIAGTGSNSTAEAISLTKRAKADGANAALLITPYYNRPTQEGLYAHYMALADTVDIPQVVYNVPSRTGVSINPETVARLASHPNIIAIKEASGSLDYVTKLRGLCDITVLSGNDNLNLPLLALGADGIISVLSNVVPRQCADMISAAKAGDYAIARKIHYDTFALCESLFIETNPVPVKAALAMMGMMTAEVRLPLVAMQEGNAKIVRAELEKLGLVEAGELVHA